MRFLILLLTYLNEGYCLFLELEVSVCFQSRHLGVGFGVSVKANSVLQFPLLLLNVGGGFDLHSGVFTSPSEGYYVFHWKVDVSSLFGRTGCIIVIEKNGVNIFPLGQAYGNMIILHLNKHDRTWVKTTSDCIYVSAMFSGFKIK